MKKKVLSLSMIVLLLAPLTALAGQQLEKDGKHDSKNPPKKIHGMLSTEGVVRGSGFRLTWIHPMRGNFAEYDKLEVVDLKSDVGERVSAEEARKYTDDLLESFKAIGIFKDVKKVEDVSLAAQPSGATQSSDVSDATASRPLPQRISSFSEGSEGQEMRLIDSSSSPPSQEISLQPAKNSLKSPIQDIGLTESLPETASRPRPPLEAPLLVVDPDALPQDEDEARLAANHEAPKRTMVISSEVIYYHQGSRAKRAFGLGLGSHRMVVRLHIYDKDRGDELGMVNISGEVQDSFGSIPAIAGDSDGRKWVVKAIVNRVELRRADASQ